MAQDQRNAPPAGGGQAAPSPKQSDVSKALEGQKRSAEKEMEEANLRAANHDGVPFPEDTPAIEQTDGKAEPWGKAGF